jgi:hypothetical protein
VAGLDAIRPPSAMISGPSNGRRRDARPGAFSNNLPKSDKYREWPKRKSWLGFYITRGEPRVIPEGALIHASALKRMDELADYRPVNLPLKFEIEPMPTSQSA